VQAVKKLHGFIPRWSWHSFVFVFDLCSNLRAQRTCLSGGGGHATYRKHPLKRQCHEIFDPRVFFANRLPLDGPDQHRKIFSISVSFMLWFQKKSARAKHLQTFRSNKHALALSFGQQKVALIVMSVPSPQNVGVDFGLTRSLGVLRCGHS
jgi:hypothetical protein